ncbi:hypothetical protein WBJ53_26350 [Spirosoma sp. SC4-14]|uniref:hypothetical protein n=1 Tax=Spirosoma sp. SC4-14 TaxID=3128900 RepID=UPI0030D41AD3
MGKLTSRCFIYLFRSFLLAELTIGICLAQEGTQSVYDLCRPELIQFTRQTYGAYNQNWSIAQHRQTRFMYFANSKGLLEYDGVSWRVYELPRKQKVRSIAVDEQGRIFTGGLGEFGYWLPETNGQLTYHSLASLVGQQSFRTEEIWNILLTPQGILFQSFAFIYRYQQGKIQLLQPPGNILFIRQVRNRLLVGVIGKGLYEIQNNRFVLLAGSEFLGSETINTLLPLGTSDLLVGTERSIYRYDGQNFRPFNSTLNALLQQIRLNRGLAIGPDQYAFGTLLGGVLITDGNGKIRYQFNQKNGLQNGTVLSMGLDVDGNLWVGMDKGIDLIGLNSPIRYFPDDEGNLGTVYDIASYGKNLYLGTNQGVYVKSVEQPDVPFRLVPGTQGQVWDLTVIDNQLLCGHNKGTFRLEGDQARLLCPITGGWVLHRLSRYPDLLIQGTYTKLCVYRKDASGNWVFSHPIDGFSAPVRQLEEDVDGNIWVNKAANQGLQRLRLPPDLRRVDTSYEFTDATFHGPTVNLCSVQNKIMITSPGGVFQYEASTGRFAPIQKLYPWLGPAVRKLFPIDKSHLFLLRQDGSLGWGSVGKQPIGDIPVKANQWVDEHENIVALDAGYVVFCQESGFAIAPMTNLTRIARGFARQPLIRTITVADASEMSYVFQGPASDLSFSHEQNNLLISFCTPFYTRPVNYSYWLENSTSTWSAFASIHQKEFTNLPPGQYTFHLKSDLNPSESNLTFEIRPPWYWTGWSKLVYILLLGGLAKLAYSFHLHRVAIQQNRVRKTMEEKLRQQEEQSQREIILLQKEQLEQGLVQKSEELANSTMSLIQKNELLMKIKDELGRAKNRLGNKLSTDDFQRINALIDANISSEQDWKLFQANFNKVHEQFLKHLLENYPDLSQGDLKLAAYLRMNLSTKEIAQLLTITHRSVELKRYRLRKKLNIEGDINLTEFMMKY